MRFGKHGEVHPRGVREVPSADNVHRLRSGGPAEPSGGRRPEAPGLVQVEGFGAEVVLPGGWPVRAGEQLRDHDPRVHGEQLEEGLRAGDERERQVPRGVEGEDALRPGPAHQVRGTVYDKELLMKIREEAYAYFHGHEVGGTNPSLLEALASTDLNLLLGVGFNREVAQDAALYWSKEPGDLAALIDHADAMSPDEIHALGARAKTTHRRRVQLAAHRRPIQKTSSSAESRRKGENDEKSSPFTNFHRSGSASGDDQVFKSETSMLEEHGHEVIRYTVSNDEFDKADAAGKLAATFGMLWSFKNYRAVVSLIREHHPDLVHVHTFFPLLSPSILYAAKTYGCAGSGYIA